MFCSIWFRILTCLALVKCLQICVKLLLKPKNLQGGMPTSVLHHLLRKMLLQLSLIVHYEILCYSFPIFICSLFG